MAVVSAATAAAIMVPAMAASSCNNAAGSTHWGGSRLASGTWETLPSPASRFRLRHSNSARDAQVNFVGPPRQTASMFSGAARAARDGSGIGDREAASANVIVRNEVAPGGDAGTAADVAITTAESTVPPEVDVGAKPADDMFNPLPAVGAAIAALVLGIGIGASGLLSEPAGVKRIAWESPMVTFPAVPLVIGAAPIAEVPAFETPLGTEVPRAQKAALQAATLRDDKIAEWYTKAMEKAKEAGSKLQSNLIRKKLLPAPEKAAPSRVPPSVVKKLRGIGDVLDNAQADVYDEIWISLESYPPSLQAYFPLMNYYAETAFPDSGDDSQRAINSAQRDALRFEADRYSKGVAKLEKAIAVKKVRNVEEAFAQTSLAYDRFLKAGDLYTGYDPVTSTTVFFNAVYDSGLQYTPVALEQPRIRDEVLVLQGPDKGKVGQVIWLGRQDGSLESEVLTAVVKLDPNSVLGVGDKTGVREVKAYPYSWIVQTRSSTESYQRDWLLATLSAIISCGLTYPLENLKCRVQLNKPPIPPEGPLALFKGVELNLLREAPNAGFLMAGFNFLTRQAVGLPFVNGNDPNLKFAVMIPSGILAMTSGAFTRVPFSDISKQVQAGLAKDLGEAISNVYLKPTPDQVWKKLATVFTLTVIKGAPFGAFQCLIYELLKDKTPALLESINFPIALEPFLWGGCAGFCTGYLTNPPDVILTRMAVEVDQGDADEAFNLGSILARLNKASQKIIDEEGYQGFLKGGWENAIYFAPEAMLWFGVYDLLKEVTLAFNE